VTASVVLQWVLFVPLPFCHLNAGINKNIETGECYKQLRQRICNTMAVPGTVLRVFLFRRQNVYKLTVSILGALTL
jgi:hypothetical protein